MRYLTILAAIFAALVIGTPASSDVDFDVLSPNASAGASSNAVADSDSAASSDNSVTIEDAKNKVHTAYAGVASGTCTSNGFGVQTGIVGASAAAPNSNCLLLTGAESFDATGDPEDAAKADNMRDRFYRNVMLETNLFKTLFKMIPIVGGLIP